MELERSRAMIRSKLSHCAVAAAMWTTLGLAMPAYAQTQARPWDADALITSALTVDGGIALARRQIGDTDLMGAIGTLERVLIANGDAVAPRLLYASLLCRLDDLQGAEVEINLLPKKAIPDANWAEVTEACGLMPRPGTGKARR